MFLKILKNLIPLEIQELIARHLQAERSYRINKKYSGIQLEDSIKNVDESTYEKYKNYREAEHQIGRFLNMKKILQKVKDMHISGDLVEFGTWQGQGLRFFDIAVDNKIDKKMIGIDSFKGLPESSTVWKKGSFSNTSYESVEKKLAALTKNFSNVTLIKGLFNDPGVAKSLYDKVNDIAIVHLDADLGSSTIEALIMLEPYLENRKQPMYFLFDDWGCHPNEVPEAFDKWMSEAESKYGIQAEMLYFTNLTRYYEISFRRN